MARQPRTFRYHCPKCAREQTVNCKYCGATYVFDSAKLPDEKWVNMRVRVGEQMYQRIVARAKVTPGVNGPQELVRLACAEVLAMPPVMLISS